MALKAINLSATKIVELDIDPEKGTPNASRFKIKTLDARVVAHLVDLTRTGAIESVGEVVAYGLAEVENFEDTDGSDMRLRFFKRNIGGKEYDRLNADVLAKIAMPVQNALAAEIFRFNSLTDDDAKN